ncbi:MAG: GIY-YIG nuclease family protein [Eubacterium sp.]|nr:GIY-YIG nuclease family protein [Eubacterium sp.]
MTNVDNLCFTYMLRCADGSLYTGWTNDLKKRVETHQAGRGGKYTHSHLPVELAYYEMFHTKEEAMRREVQLKRLPKAQKELLVAQFQKEGPSDHELA